MEVDLEVVKITADSTCDLSQELLADLNVTLVPLHIVVDSDIFNDGVDISPADVFNYVELEEKTCKTASVNIYEYEKVFTDFASDYDAIIHISLGSKFSSSYQNACLAAQNFENVYVIDSENLSTGSGYLVYEAASLAKAGEDAQTICGELKKAIPQIEASFVIDQLGYLHRGGRCSGLEAFSARLLQIKPRIDVVDGTMLVGKKYRGTFDRCLEHYVEDILKDRASIDPARVFLTNCMCSSETVTLVRDLLTNTGIFKEIIEADAGCAIASHCGPNTLGIFIKKQVRKVG